LENLKSQTVRGGKIKILDEAIYLSRTGISIDMNIFVLRRLDNLWLFCLHGNPA